MKYTANTYFVIRNFPNPLPCACVPTRIWSAFLQMPTQNIPGIL